MCPLLPCVCMHKGLCVRSHLFVCVCVCVCVCVYVCVCVTKKHVVTCLPVKMSSWKGHTLLTHLLYMVSEMFARSIDPLHVTSHFGHFCIRLFGCRHVGCQKCIAVIEKKALNISLFTNVSDYSNKTCTERSMCLYLTNIVVLLE